MERERESDTLLVFALTGLVMAGIMSVTMASLGKAGYTYSIKQLIWAMIGMLLITGLRTIPYRLLARHAIAIYTGGIILLASVYFIGKKVNGATSWIDLGPISLQPSELARLTSLILLAHFYDRHKGVFTRTGDVWKAILTVLLPTLLVLAQPDLGMAMVYLSLLGCFFVMAKVPLWIPLLTMTGAVAMIAGLYSLYHWSPDLFFQLVRPHQFERITSFLHPENDPLGSGYQYIQAQRYVKSGSLGGTGDLWLSFSTDGKLPEQHTDFIFAVIAQKWGFIGASGLVLLYFLLFYRMISLAMLATDRFVAFFLSGIVTMWAFQVFVNIGMNIGLSPITGLTLPFVSYGGSSLLSNMMAIGLILGMIHPSPLQPLEYTGFPYAEREKRVRRIL